MKKLYYIVPLLLVAAANPDEVKKDLEQVNLHYQQADNMKMEIVYDYYATHTATTPVQSQEGLSIKQGSTKQYNQLESIETIKNGDKILQVDHSTQTIVLQKNTRQQQGISQLMQVMQSALSGCEAMNFLSVTNSKKELELIHTGSNYEKIVLTYHPKKYSLSKVVLYSRMPGQTGEKSRMEINIEETGNYKANEEVFSFSKYLTKTEGGYTLNTAFKSKAYNFINMYQN